MILIRQGYCTHGNIWMTYFNFRESTRSPDERGALFVAEGYPALACAEDKPNSAFDDPDEGHDGKDERCPVDKSRRCLVGEDGPEGPCNGDGGREVALRGRESIGSRGTLEEEEGKENEDFCPYASGKVQAAYTEGVECSDDDENGGPTVVKREGEMDEELISVTLGTVMLFDDVIDVSNSGADKEGEDEGNDVMVCGPQVDVDGVEDTKEGETP